VEFVGLTVPQALAAFAVAAGVVTALYLLKLRRRPVQVAYLALWSEVLTEAPHERALLAAHALGILARVAALRCARGGVPSRTRGPPRGERTLHVLLVDASLSMQATEGGSTRFSLAVEQAQAYVDRLAEGDAAMVITLAAHPSAEPITTEPAALQRALASIEVTDTEADVTRALELAFDATLGQRPAQVVLFTDGAVTVPPALLRRMDEAGLSLHAVPIEESAAAPASAPSNFAITALAARPHPLDASRAEVLLEVESFADREAEIEVRLDTEGRAIEVLRLTLPPRERVRRFFTDVSGLDRTLEAHLSVVSGPRRPIAWRRSRLHPHRRAQPHSRGGRQPGTTRISRRRSSSTRRSR
jgi:Ca-activated chloride channel family protein